MIFSLGAMSFGSISYETHTTLATAMNKWVVVCFDSFKFLRQSGFVDLLVCIECNWSLLIIAILIGGRVPICACTPDLSQCVANFTFLGAP